MKNRLINILFWSIIAAAFIGPGTVTTAASAGAGFGYTLIWALLFSVIACFVLQEAATRLTTVSGYNLGQALQKEYSETAAGKTLIYTSLFAILLGCAAYEAGNIVGAVSGIHLLADIPQWTLVLMIGGVAFGILWAGSIQKIALLLGGIVALMGFCFLGTALLMDHSPVEMVKSAFVPTIPSGAEIMVLGLIGTTVVPYNIFLGSGMKHTQTPSEMKISLAIAIGLGGVISISVLLVGTAIAGRFTFEALAAALELQLGTHAPLLLGIGLFSAGISSTLTAALAAAVTARSILDKNGESEDWGGRGFKFRTVWIGVLAIGLFFGILDLQPVPVIILAQALNGVILPVIAVVLLILINHHKFIPAQHQSGIVYTFMTGLVVFITIVIGLTNITRALTPVFGVDLVDEQFILISAIILALLISWPVLRTIRRVKHPE